MDGLLGVAGMMIDIVDHSRKFPAFGSLAPVSECLVTIWLFNIAMGNGP